MGLSFSNSNKTTQNFTENNLKDDDVVTNLSGDVDAEDSAVNQLSGTRGGVFNIASTDQGTVKRAFDFAGNSVDRSFDFVGDSFEQALGFGAQALEVLDDSTEDVIATVQSTAQSAIQSVTDNNRTETDKLFEQASKFGLYALGAVIIIIGIMAWKGNQ